MVAGKGTMVEAGARITWSYSTRGSRLIMTGRSTTFDNNSGIMIRDS